MLTLLRIPAFRNRYAVRGLLVWIAIRLALTIGGLFNPSALIETAILGIAAAAVLLDAHFRDEDLFLGNLGVPALAIALFALPLAALVELLIP